MKVAPIKRPVLRWHGGKWKIADWIIGFFPKHRVYVEPFGGGGSVLLKKPKAHLEIYNDLDAGVVNLFRILRDPEKSAKLTSLLRLTPFSRQEFEDSYNEDNIDEIEFARRFVVRSYMGFGSDSCNRGVATGFRVSATRAGTSSGGDWASYPNNLAAVLERLQGVTIERRPGMELMRFVDSTTTLHYVDPPYPFESRSKKRIGNYAHEMTDQDHRALGTCLHELKGYVMVSGYRCELNDELYAGWERHDRAIFTNGGHARTECVWLNPHASEHGQGQLL